MENRRSNNPVAIRRAGAAAVDFGDHHVPPRDLGGNGCSGASAAPREPRAGANSVWLGGNQRLRAVFNFMTAFALTR